jgi:hypothetical protein
MRSTSTVETRNHDPQHLLDRSANFFGHLLRCTAVLPMATMAMNTLGHVRVDMRWQVSDVSRSPLARERSKSDRKRHPPPDRANIVALLGHPADVLLDLGADPRRSNALNRLWFGEIRFQHDNFPSPVGWRK